ncbi:MAG: transporter permease, partial [Microbacterium sp.]
MSVTASRGALTSLRVVVLIIGTIVMVTPFLYMLSTSFKPQAYVLTTPPQFIPDPITFDNYVQAWTTQDFSRYAMNSLIVAVIATALSVLFSSMMAYAFTRFEFPGREWIFRALLIGLMVPAMMLIIPQFVLAKYFGLLDSLAGLIVFYVAGSLALNTFLLRGFARAGHRDDLHLPRLLGRVRLGADHHQQSAEPHLADRDSALSGSKRHAMGAGVRGIRHRNHPRRRRLPDLPTPLRTGPHLWGRQRMNMPLTLLPTRASYGPADPISIEIRGAETPREGTLTVRR